MKETNYSRLVSPDKQSISSIKFTSKLMMEKISNSIPQLDKRLTAILKPRKV